MNEMNGIDVGSYPATSGRNYAAVGAFENRHCVGCNVGNTMNEHLAAARNAAHTRMQAVAPTRGRSLGPDSISSTEGRNGSADDRRR